MLICRMPYYTLRRTDRVFPDGFMYLKTVEFDPFCIAHGDENNVCGWTAVRWEALKMSRKVAVALRKAYPGAKVVKVSLVSEGGT